MPAIPFSEKPDRGRPEGAVRADPPPFFALHDGGRADHDGSIGAVLASHYRTAVQTVMALVMGSLVRDNAFKNPNMGRPFG